MSEPSDAALAIRIIVLSDGLFENADWWNIQQDVFGGMTGDELIAEKRLKEVYDELLRLWNARAKSGGD